MNSRCLKLYRTYSISFNLSHVDKFFGSWILKDCIKVQQLSFSEKESCCLVYRSSTKPEIRHFHVVVVQRRHRNVRKSVMHVQSCCFANLNLLLFWHSHCRRCRSCWDVLGDELWPSFLGNLVIANERSDSFPKQTHSAIRHSTDPVSNGNQYAQCQWHRLKSLMVEDKQLGFFEASYREFWHYGSFESSKTRPVRYLYEKRKRVSIV